jgi:glycosyltransferase involved in cell wall biosynthesis
MTPASGLRVLMSTDAVGGVWVYSVTLARALAARGIDVVLVILGPRPRRDQLLALNDVRNLEVEITDFPLEWMDPQGSDIERTREGLRSIASRAAPDLVHLNSYREALGDWNVPVLVVAHSCVRSWWLACRGEEPDEARWLTYIANVLAGLAAAKKWVAPTAAFRDVVQRVYTPPSAGAVVHNALDEDIGPTLKEPFILAAGRLWDEAKNVQAVASAATHLDWPVRLAGESTPLQVFPDVEFMGELPRACLLDLMARASVFAAPALYEPFGLCVLEAAMAGCALVLADIASLRELWSGAAVFVDPRDARGLAAALRRVCDDQQLRSRLQREARLRARRYSLTEMVDGYCALYGDLLHASADRSEQPELERCA